MSTPDSQSHEPRDDREPGPGGLPASEERAAVDDSGADDGPEPAKSSVLGPEPDVGSEPESIEDQQTPAEPAVDELPADELPAEENSTEELSADNGAVRRVRARWLVAGVAAAAALVWVLALTIGPGGVNRAPEVAPVVPPAAPSLVPGRGSEGTESGPRLAQQSPAQPSAETGFLGDVHKDEGVAPALDDANAVGIAYQACAALRSGGTRASVEAAVVDAGTSDPKAADALVGAAVQNMCPEEKDRPVARDMRDGSYRVGVDVEAGKYVAPGGDACSWIRSKVPGENLANVIDSGSGANGSATVTLEGGQYFVSSRCGDWTKS